MQIPPGPGKTEDLSNAIREAKQNKTFTAIDSGFGIIIGDFCGVCLRKCPVCQQKRDK